MTESIGVGIIVHKVGDWLRNKRWNLGRWYCWYCHSDAPAWNKNNKCPKCGRTWHWVRHKDYSEMVWDDYNNVGG